jgi:hypothetical protein
MSVFWHHVSDHEIQSSLESACSAAVPRGTPA